MVWVHSKCVEDEMWNDACAQTREIKSVCGFALTRISIKSECHYSFHCIWHTLIHMTHSCIIFYWYTIGIFCRDENASVRRYHPRNYKERYKSRFPRRLKNHKPIQTTWEKWKKLCSNILYIITIWAASLAIRLNLCAVNGLRSILLDIISVTLACHEMIASH